MMTFTELAGMCWSVADILRGPYKPFEYGKIILPFTVLRRLDCALQDTKTTVLAEYKRRSNAPKKELETNLAAKTGLRFFNTSRLDFARCVHDHANLRQNLLDYLDAFSDDIKDIFVRFEFHKTIAALDERGLLFSVAQTFNGIDLHPDQVSNELMGSMFEELIRRFADASNETAGEHFTPREVVQLMVSLLLNHDQKLLRRRGLVRSVYDPTAGTGGMLSVAEAVARALNSSITLRLYGQELNPESYAICKADMLFKGQDQGNVAYGNTLTKDAFPDKTFDYMLSNPPFGVDWKTIQSEIEREAEAKGFDGRFGAGLPAVRDGQMLFLQHLVHKMTPADAEGSGGRIAIVLNGSPLFGGDAGSGESNIRKWLLEGDMVEAIIALPREMFFNTGIATYVWVLTNRKEKNRKGKVLLVNAESFCERMKRTLGSKRNEMRPQHIDRVLALYDAFEDADIDGVPYARVLKNEEFGYRSITIDRPLRDENGNPVLVEKGKQKGQIKADTSLRDSESVPLLEDIRKFFAREVLPHAADAWIDEDKTKTGYEIPFNRYFHVFAPLRDLREIDEDLKTLAKDMASKIEALSK